MDVSATRVELELWTRGYAATVEREAQWLRRNPALVLGDVPPLAFDAAAEAGLPSVAVANFSWDWIYSAMGFDAAATQAARAYGRATVLLELEPAAPMPAFSRRLGLGVLGRKPIAGREAVRARLGLDSAEHLVLVAFRSSGVFRHWRLPPPRPGLRYAIPGAPELRSDIVPTPTDMPFIDLVGAADAVVAKPGYGILADTAACGVRLLCTERQGFPEDAVLNRWMAGRPGVQRLVHDRFAEGGWLDPLETLLAREPPEPVGTHGLAAGLTLVRDLLRG